MRIFKHKSKMLRKICVMVIQHVEKITILCLNSQWRVQSKGQGHLGRGTQIFDNQILYINSLPLPNSTYAKIIYMWFSQNFVFHDVVYCKVKVTKCQTKTLEKNKVVNKRSILRVSISITYQHENNYISCSYNLLYACLSVNLFVYGMPKVF